MRAFFGYDGIRHCANKPDSISRKRRPNGRLGSLANPVDFRRGFVLTMGVKMDRSPNAPAIEPIVDRRMRAVALRQIPPWRACAQNPGYFVQDRRPPRATPRGLFGGNGSMPLFLRAREYTDLNLSLPIRDGHAS
jgi:hypothetical protein